MCTIIKHNFILYICCVTLCYKVQKLPNFNVHVLNYRFFLKRDYLGNPIIQRYYYLTWGHVLRNVKYTYNLNRIKEKLTDRTKEI